MIFLFAALVAIEIYGFATCKLFAQQIWFPAGVRRFTHYIGEYIAISAPLLVLVPWSLAGVMAVLVVVLTAIAVGPVPLLTVLFFLLSCWCVGQASACGGLQSALLGLSVYVFLMTLLARVPMHYPLVWAVILAIPIAIKRPRNLPRLPRLELRSWSERGAFALLVFFIVAHWLVALKPETSHDGLAMHLAVPTNIAAYHKLTYEPARILWSVMPMGADWAWSIVYLLGGEYACRILTFAMLLIILALLYRAARRWLSHAAAMLVTASFAGTALVQLVTGEMFVENFLAALVLGIYSASSPYAAAILAGAAMTTKLGALAFIIPAAPFFLRRSQKPALAAALFLATAAPTYAIAYFKTGNPVFPFNNRKIHSPLLDPTVDVNDARFRHALTPATLYNLTFHTSDAYEGQDGSFGFQYLVVVPLALAGLFVVRDRCAYMAAAMAFVGSVAILLMQPNVRYLYTAMPLALIAFAAALGWMLKNHRLLFRAVVFYLLACAVLNAWFLPAGGYFHKDFSIRMPLSRAEHERYRNEAAPVRSVIDYFNQHHAGSTVLLPGPESTIAGIRGDVYINGWHQYPTVAALRRAYTIPDMLKLLRGWNVQYFIVPKSSADVQIRPLALKSVLERCTAPEFVAGGWYLARLEPGCNVSVVLVAPHGYIDDFDPVIQYRGDWDHDDTFEQPDNHTVSYTDVPGAEISLTFEGKGVTYVFTKAPNRGIAEITVDGLPQGTVDLYSPRIEWGSQKYFCCFPVGRHILVIRVTGRSDPASTGKFVDLDSFNVQ
jgi:hypothetical protein